MNDIGKLVLRVTLGALILFHGIAKMQGGVSGVQGLLASAGLPGFVAYGVYVGEVLAPILLVVGFYARVGAALIVVNMLFALALAHTGMFFTLAKSGGWAIELQVMYLLTAFALVLLGPGRISINQG